MHFDSINELECLAAANRGIELFSNASSKLIYIAINIFKDILGYNEEFWTAGTNRGALSEDNFSWCSTNNSISPDLWQPREPQDPWTKRAVFVSLTTDPTVNSLLMTGDEKLKLKILCKKK